MNTAAKIHQLWRYLKIQDNEILIVRAYNQSKETDEFFVTETTDNGLQTTTTANMPELRVDRPFRLIQQRDSSGKYIIPSVKQLIRDELIDY